jgi:Virulence factor membrane-bound polymerase, C-terminal/O-Antigen ligase
MHYSFGLAAMTLAWLLPGHFYPYTSFQQDFLSIVAVVLLALAASQATSKEVPAQVPVSSLFACVLAGIPLLQWAVGLVPFVSDAILPASYLVGFALSVVAAKRLTGHPGFTHTNFGLLALAALVSTTLGLTQWLGLGPIAHVEPWTRGDRIVANLVQPNQLACLLALGVVATLWFFERKVVGVATTAIALAWLALGLALTQSRAAWLMLGAVAGLWLWHRQRLELRTTGSLLFGLACVTGLFAALRAPLFELWQVAETASIDQVMALRAPENLRLVHWQTLWDALMRAPWVGYGWLQVAAAQQAAALDHAATYELLSAAHNQYLDFLVWNGLPLGIAINLLIAWWFLDRVWRCQDVDAWAALAALGVFAAHSLVEFPLQYAYFLVPAGVLVGLIEARTPPRCKGQVRLALPRSALLAVSLFISVGLYLVWDEYLEVDEAVRQVRLKNESRIVHKDLHPRAPEVWLLDAQREYVRFWTIEPTPGMPVKQLDWMRMVARRFGAPGALERYALAAGLNGRPDEARHSLQLMCRMAVARHCDRGRVAWEQQAAVHTPLRAIPYPPTPTLLKKGAPG